MLPCCIPTPEREMDLSIWLAFVAASTALLMIPGPPVLLVLSYALGQGRRVAVPAALGVATGDLIAMGVMTSSLRRAAA
jgi:threonine/homoserine/homoserine lactone efflux protein